MTKMVATYFKCTSVWECMASPHTRPVSSTTAAAVSSQLVSIPRTSLGGERTPGETRRLLKNPYTFLFGGLAKTPAVFLNISILTTLQIIPGQELQKYDLELSFAINSFT